MAATYDPTDLDDSTVSGRRNIVRLLLSDNTVSAGTTVLNPEFDDAEIDFFVATSSGTGDDIYAGAIAAARSAVSKYAKSSGARTVGDLSIDFKARASEWRSVISALQAARAEQSPGVAPLIGQDTESAEYSPVFSLGMDDNPRNADDTVTT